MLHPHQHCIDLCNRALESVHAQIPDDLYQNVHDFINKHDEWGLGIEVLIDEISEDEIKISLEQYRVFEQAMASMGLDDSD